MSQLDEQGRKAAERFRKAHGLGTNPLGDLVTLVEQTTEADVAIVEAGPDEHGLTMRHDRNGSIFIAVASTANAMRQRSTLAHELAHVLFEDWSETEEYTARPPSEVRADSFARHLLIPGEGIKKFVQSHGWNCTEAELSKIVQWFLVSPMMAAIALEHHGYIDEVTKERWKRVSTRQLATRYGWMDQYKSLQSESQRSRAPQRLLARAVTGYEEGLISAQQIANIRGISEAEVLKEFDEIGLTPQVDDVDWLSAEDLPEVQVDLSDLDDAPDWDEE